MGRVWIVVSGVPGLMRAMSSRLIWRAVASSRWHCASSFFRLGQGLVELFDAGIGRVGDGGVAEVCEYLAAEDLAEAAA